ncbi:MAG: ArsC/Spx/MgsR family protein [Myxococcaceae bacterium]
MEIWINPACSKCQNALSALDEAGVVYTVRRYLEDPPTAAELSAVLERLGIEPWEIARTKEPLAAEMGLEQLPRDSANRRRWIEALVQYPMLIQRPILTAEDGTTVVGRDRESLEKVIRTER